MSDICLVVKQGKKDSKANGLVWFQEGELVGEVDLNTMHLDPKTGERIFTSIPIFVTQDKEDE